MSGVIDLLIASFREPSAAAAFAARLGDHATIFDQHTVVARSAGGWAEGPTPLMAAQGDVVDRRRAALLTLGAISAALASQGDSALTDWSPPFRVAWTGNGGVNAAADSAGLANWFHWQGDGVAAVAASATAIARAFGLAPDTRALGGLALTGAMINDDSAIAGVHKLLSGTGVRLTAGQRELRALPPASVLSAPGEALAAATQRLLAAYPTAEVELSGGWDSRMILAAIPSAARKGRTGFTIGSAEAPDVIVARRLAAAGQMVHEIVDPARIAALGPESFAALLATAAARDDYASNPLDRAVLNFVNAARPPAPRFSGQNGEILRGFYYPGQPLTSAPSAALARRVIDWRIIANDVVSPTLFRPDWLDTMRADAVSRLEGLLVGGGDGDWGAALDRYYLEQRMQRWCGTSVSAALGMRPILLPFFDADVLALARATPAAEKAGSRFAAATITRLDAELGAIALDSGLTPAAVAAGGIANRLAQARKFAAKAAAKVQQKLFTRDRASFGSATSLGLARSHGLFSAIDLHRLSGLGIFADSALEGFARGTTLPSRATGGFMLNCHYLLERLDNGTTP